MDSLPTQVQVDQCWCAVKFKVLVGAFRELIVTHPKHKLYPSSELCVLTLLGPKLPFPTAAAAEKGQTTSQHRAVEQR